MSDFDTVLERLLTDPHFQAALAADPARALAGYRLEESERELLGAQVVAGAGEDRTVELRTSKSGVVGLLGPVAAALGLAAAGSAGGSHNSLGNAPSGDLLGNAPSGDLLGNAPSGDLLGNAPSGDLLGNAPGGDVLGNAPGGDVLGNASGGDVLANASGGDSLGDAPALGGSSGDSLGDAPAGGSGADSLGSAPVEAVDYHTRVDVDGDGKWDAYTAYERADGGVDIVVDVDHDGRIDFVGHDLNRDRLVDVAEFDNDGDGTLETRMYDDTGDGWMDRSEQIPVPPQPTGQAAPAPGHGSGDSWGDAPAS